MRPQAKPRLLITREEIEAAVRRLAAEVWRDYQDRCPLLIGILKGSFMFMADLVRFLDMPVEVEFVRVSSYGSSTKSSGKLRVAQGHCSSVAGRDVLVVEDIVDTGLTCAYLLSYLRKRKPASLKLCALADKPSRRQVPVTIDYLGFTVPNKFVVGYGLDWDERFRYLPAIYTLENCE